MSKVKVTNTFAIKLTIIIFASIASIIVIFYAIKILATSNSLSYDLGEKNLKYEYKDILLKNYDDYLKIVKEYDLKKDLSINNFSSHYFLASFQDYDSCSESKIKYVSDVSIDESINITFKVYNKCGWCKSHKMVYFIKISKNAKENMDIKYDYEYQKTLDCGNI